MTQTWLGSVLLFLVVGCNLPQFATASSSGASNPAADSGAVCVNDSELVDAVRQDVRQSLLHSELMLPDEIGLCVAKEADDVRSAIQDCSASTSDAAGVEDEAERGDLAWRFLRGVANSPTFINQFWHKRPLLLRQQDTGGWVEDYFTVDRDLRLVDNSYISGHKTAEVLRNGTNTKTWALAPIKANPASKTTWKEVKEALDGGTIYFNTAGGLWPTLGGLCRLTGYAFGLPPNVNVYVTPPGTIVSVPPHTDKQDVFVMQTGGAKRWRVFAPPARSKGKDPLNRGKSGDVLSLEEMGPPIIDTILQKGDVLYVPTGFPHTTDTSTVMEGFDSDAYEETSIHLTMGLDTHVWCLTMAHMRWTLLQRLGLAFNLNIEDDEAYWTAMDSMPLGFLGGAPWRRSIENMKAGKEIDSEYSTNVATHLRNILTQLEPSRWADLSDVATSNGDLGSNDKDNDTDNDSGKKILPDLAAVHEVTDFMVRSHWASLMENQESLFSDIDPTSEATIIKAFQGTQDQNLIMEKFGRFSKNDAFANSFAQRRMMAASRLQGL